MSGLTYTDVRNANLTPLSEAVTQWKNAPNKFQQIQIDFYNLVTKGLDTSDWEGEARDGAMEKFEWIQKQVSAAVSESLHVYNVMSEGLTQFTAAKKALEAIETELEGHKHLRLNKTDGSVYLQLSADEEPSRSALTKSYEDTFEHYRDRTRKAIEQAAQADSALVQALTADVNGESRGFNEKAYDSLGEARREAEKDLKQAVSLGGIENGKMSSDQLKQLSELMSRHSKDPLFAEGFATGLGPEKTLQLWYNATHPRNLNFPDTDIDEKVWWPAAENLQVSLGTTLATATHSDSPDMKAWKDEILRMGPERLESGGNTHPYGYQVMSNLMRFGTYDAKFLNTYGDRLLAWDKKNNTRDGLPYWSNNADVDMLNLHGAKKDGWLDQGHDPVIGFLEGLGHNPAASTEFFKQPGGVNGVVDQKSEINSHLAYLAQERNWIFDGNTSGEPRRMPGHEALGHALTAATTGYAWDAEELRGKDPEIFNHGGDRRTAGTADVMEQVVAVYGGENGPRLLHEQPSMATSLGVMGGSYVDDINYAVSGVGDSLENDAFPAGYKGRADFGSKGAVDFLSVLGQNPESHGIMNQAEHLYTLDRFAQNPSAEGVENYAHSRRALLTEAEVRGILDHSLAAQIDATYQHDKAAAEAAYKNSTDWTRVGMSAGAPAVAQGIVNIVGKSGPWGLAIPVVMGGATEFAKLFHNDVVFSGPRLPEPAASSELFENGVTTLGKTAEQYEFPKYEKEYGAGVDAVDAKGTLSDRIKQAYLGTGTATDLYRGRGPYTP
ncbi:DUF6571 family protein [Streptomyces sp. SAJ15]|uniref:DUF6571 family protein n=1 Tax=Streptomyces sp. SAJ15 TaxID=2011095 RepID=UPI0011858A46|nr:DUF6571 family protein [Streptomyces sp. SAJ15]TVL91783.1 hypothetical protein CD790_13845 [Streptomyces sp. SAJ15]